MTEYSSYRFPTITKDPEEVRSVILSFYSMCVLTWRRNEIFDADEIARPAGRPTGFAYQSSGGTSGIREPVWPRVLGANVVDGSVTWVAIAASTNGLNPITSIVAEDETGGLVALAPIVIESVKVSVDYTGGVVGQNHVVKYTAMINGAPRVARQIVKIRKR